MIQLGASIAALAAATLSMRDGVSPAGSLAARPSGRRGRAHGQHHQPAQLRALDHHRICLVCAGAFGRDYCALQCQVNPTPSATTHTPCWKSMDGDPGCHLVAIAIPSFRLLYFEDVIPPADMTIKAIGKQWFWSYEYPDNGNFTFDALGLSDRVAATQMEPRLLGTNNHVVVPVNKTIRLLTTGADVIHAWTIPAFGVKIDAIPGRINQSWFKATREGKFYGQCSELCGARHAFMPIEVEVVSQERFDQWVTEAKTKFAAVGAPTRVAAER
jgi:cytochrome c oxidase subunit 2